MNVVDMNNCSNETFSKSGKSTLALVNSASTAKAETCQKKTITLKSMVLVNE